MKHAWSAIIGFGTSGGFRVCRRCGDEMCVSLSQESLARYREECPASLTEEQAAHVVALGVDAGSL